MQPRSLSLSCSPFGSIHHFFAFSAAAAAAGGAAYMFKAKGESERARGRASSWVACLPFIKMPNGGRESETPFGKEE